MIKNYLITALRFFSRNIIFTGINIIGLALAIAICIVAYFNTKHNIDWDKGHENYEQIYKVSITKENNGKLIKYGVTPYKLAESIQNDIPLVDEVSRFHYLELPIKWETKIFNQQVAFADPKFSEIFTINIISGDVNSINDNGNILIDERLAKKYFGEDDPVGKVVSIFNNDETESTFVIGAIFSGFPVNSSFSFSAITNINNLEKISDINSNSWKQMVGATFLLINQEEKVASINKVLQNYIKDQNVECKDFQIYSYFIEPMKLAHKQQNRQSNFLQPSFPSSAVLVPLIMAVFVLIISCCNYANSAIAFAGKRLKEIGVRKVFGSKKKQVIIQFLTENLIITLFSLIIGLIISIYLLKAYSLMWQESGMHFKFEWSLYLILFLIVLLVVVTIFAGSYPAFYISKFNPIKIFKDKVRLSSKNILTKFLVGFQLFISAIAIVAGIMFAQNAIYQKNMDLGYNLNDILIIKSKNSDQVKLLKQAIADNSKIISCSNTKDHIGFGVNKQNLIFEETKLETYVINIGHNYLETLEIELLEGRCFNEELKATDINENSIIVNKEFIKQFGLNDPIGKTFYFNDTTPLRIIGVVEDFYLYGYWSPVRPVAFRLSDEKDNKRLIVRAQNSDLIELNNDIKNSWEKLFPNLPYESQYQEDIFYKQAMLLNENLKVMNFFLAIVAICLSAVGLYTLISINILLKNKDIGIRKVNGASVIKIIMYMNKPFILLVSIPLTFGLIIGYFISLKLMDSIWVNHTNGGFISIFITSLIIILIYSSTVIWKSYKASIQNPASLLRYE